MSSHAEAQARD